MLYDEVTQCKLQSEFLYVDSFDSGEQITGNAKADNLSSNSLSFPCHYRVNNTLFPREFFLSKGV